MKTALVLQFLAAILAFAAAAGPEVTLSFKPDKAISACADGSGCRQRTPAEDPTLVERVGLGGELITDG